MDVLLCFLCLIVLGLMIVLLVKINKLQIQDNSKDSADIEQQIAENTTKISALITGIHNIFKETANIEGQLKNIQQTQRDINKDQQQVTGVIDKRFAEIKEENIASLLKITDTINKRLDSIENKTNSKLTDIQNNVNEKLDTSLNKRLDDSFKQVGERLESLYKSLGELSNLQNGVNQLNSTLSNVKTRGVFGEAQLGQLLASVFGEEGQVYFKNVKTKRNTEFFVEYAVKLPDKKSNTGFVYLPIDSKFHSEVYEHIITASKKNDSAALSDAIKTLKTSLLKDAEDIHTKYIDPIQTTDFAIMFLPTESLFAEALRIEGLSEQIQKKYKVVIAGPTTLIALLNSFAVGFNYMKLNENAKEIENALSVFKTEFNKFDTYISKSQKKIQETKNVIDELSNRSRLTQKKLSSFATVDYEKTKEVLGITEEIETVYEDLNNN